jgi:hypothetical protein
MVQSQANEVTNPRALAAVVGVVGATFAVILVFVLTMPLVAFGIFGTRDVVFVAIGTAIWIFSVSFLAMLLRYSNRKLQRALFLLGMKSLKTASDTPPPQVETFSPVGEPAHEEDSGLGEDWLEVKGTHKMVRLTHGITRAMLAKLASAGLQAVSQRALDSANVVTRDPAVATNAKVLITWLSRNDFIKPIGNNRHKFTPLGESLLKTVGGTSSAPPPTTAVE